MPASAVVLRIREGAGNHESLSPVQNQCHNAEKEKASVARPSQRNATVLRTLPFFFCPHFSTGGGFDIGRYGAIQAHQILQ